MKIKGFTLIELSAVITILGLLAVMISPVVTDIIEHSKKSVAEESGESLISAAEYYFLMTKQNYGRVDVLTSGLKYKGDKPEYEEVQIDSTCRSRLYAYVNGYCVTKSYDGKIEVEDKEKEECDYFPGVICTAKKESTNGNVPQGNYDYGDEYRCYLGDGEKKTFYVLENNDDTVSLIMNMNIDSSGKGITSGSIVAWSYGYMKTYMLIIVYHMHIGHPHQARWTSTMLGTCTLSAIWTMTALALVATAVFAQLKQYLNHN